MKLIKKMSLALTIGLFASPLSAFIHPCDGEFAFQGELLYLLPDVGPTYYVFETDAVSTTGSVGTGTRVQNQFCFKPGFRLEAAYGLCGHDLRLEWTHLHCGSRHSTTSGSMDPTMTTQGTRSTGGSGTFAGTAKSHIRHGYDEVSLMFGQPILNCCSFSLDMRGGLQYAYVDDKDYREYSHTDGSFEQTKINSRFWGVGPEIALASSYYLCNWQDECSCNPSWLSLEGLVSGSLLVSQTNAHFNYVAFGPAFPIASDWHSTDQKKWMVVPAWHAELGLNYEICFECFKASLEIGYEFTVYNNALAQTSGFASSVGETRTIYYNYTNHGPFLALGVTF